MNPVPGVEFEGCLGEADDFEALWHQRFNHNIVAWGKLLIPNDL
jgi:hypothetical protein